ncbi:MAG: hypothetical protein DRJ03_09815 [Chloroflexi bacterium]|nr:MAG: hypothetical protein DRJ03_09815 [Chloroflexota bacterium]
MPPKIPRPVILAAKEAFVTSPERPKWAELARRFGVSERTLRNYARLEGWREERDQFQARIQALAAMQSEPSDKAKTIATAISERVADYLDTADKMQKALATVFLKLAQEAAKGQISLKDIPPEVRVRLLAILPKAWAELIKLIQLLEKQPTERVEVLGDVHLTPEEEEMIDALWDRLIHSN